MSNQVDTWLPVVGYEGFYEVSNNGRVRGLTRQVLKHDGVRTCPSKILLPDMSKGYPRVVLGRGGNRKRVLVHRLVAEAFIPNQFGKPVVNHKDGNRSNNCVSNLEWCTQRENAIHAHRTGLQVVSSGESNPMFGRRGAKTNRAKAVVSKTTGKFWGSLIDAAAELGINYSTARNHMWMGKGDLAYASE